MSGMRALGVIKADPVANHPLGNEAVGQLVQVTEDTDLAEVTKKYGGKCLSVPELLNQCAR
jgi:hypothetical protein